MRGIRLYAILAAMFMAGAFLASPELRAYAANTIGSADIINNSIQSVDIKDGEVKTADIATGAVAAGRIADGAVGTLKIADDSIMAVDIKADAVGASELQGVTKLIFVTCTAFYVLSPGEIEGSICSVPGAASTDRAIASINSGPACWSPTLVVTSTDKVTVYVKSDCSATGSQGIRISVIVFST